MASLSERYLRAINEVQAVYNEMFGTAATTSTAAPGRARRNRRANSPTSSSTATGTRGRGRPPKEKTTIDGLPEVIQRGYAKGATPAQIRKELGWGEKAPMSQIDNQLVKTGRLVKAGNRYVYPASQQVAA